jgi:hypothetical protein
MTTEQHKLRQLSFAHLDERLFEKLATTVYQ